VIASSNCQWETRVGRGVKQQECSTWVGSVGKLMSSNIIDSYRTPVDKAVAVRRGRGLDDTREMKTSLGCVMNSAKIRLAWVSFATKFRGLDHWIAGLRGKSRGPSSADRFLDSAHLGFATAAESTLSHFTDRRGNP
jgi:hypothetical protein